MNDIFGCDIGNGYGYISVLKNENTDPIVLLPSKISKEGMPTSAYIASSSEIEVFNGRSAIDKYGNRNANKIVHAIKTRMVERQINVDGISVNTDDIYAAIVRDLVKLGNEARQSRGEEKIYDLVFTFPASISNDIAMINRMQNSIEKNVIDGHRLHVVSRLPEPAAVAVDYLYYMKNVVENSKRIVKDEYSILVYDLGHGTFDVAVVSVKGNETPRLLVKDGISNVGGKNIDEIVYNAFCGQLNQKYGYIPKNDNERERIRQAAINAKLDLSENEEWMDEIIGLGSDIYTLEMSREQLNELISDLVLKTIDMTNDIFDEMTRKNIKIDAIVLSGGSSQIPIIRQSLEEVLGKEVPIHIYRPNSAVSFGAARYAYGEKIRILNEERRRIEEEERRRQLEEEERRRQLKEKERRRQLEEEKRKHQIEIARLRDEKEKREKEEEYRREKEKKEHEIKELEKLKNDLQRQLNVETNEPKRSSSILEQVTDYSYGIWIPSQENLAGEIFMLVKAGEKLPAKSSKIKLGTAAFETTIKLYRSKSKGSFSRIIDIENMAQSILWPKFSTEAGSTCEISIIVKEDYNIDIICELENGTRIIKSTVDNLGKLYD